ncbi:multidrug effflux MFS transporter [uncultured Bradyrhizobium sp.]|uniref:multidrug effflux MFS transporter n=1 Tax=uncultured Bradyrhizobium sp. TaxID=199684 RepID=UPI0035C96A73
MASSSHDVFADPRNAFVTFLAMLSGQNLLATNIMIPGLPEIARETGASTSTVQLILTLFFAAYAGSLLIYGPLSDRFGRKPVLLGSLAIYCLGSLGCAAAHSATALISGRIVQGLGAGGGTVMAWAIARDSFEGPLLLRATSLINAGRSAVPAAAPAIGGVLVEFGGWKTTFLMTCALGGLLFGAAALFLPETALRHQATSSMSNVARNYGRLFRSVPFLTYALTASGSLGTWFAFLAASPGLFIQTLGLSPSQYGLCPVLMASGSVFGGLVTARLAARSGTDWLARFGLISLLVGTTAAYGLAMMDAITVGTIIVPMFLVSFGCGVVFPTAAAAGMQECKVGAGSGFAVIGFLSMIVAALSTFLVSLFSDKNMLAFSAVMVGWACLSAASYAFARLNKS